VATIVVKDLRKVFNGGGRTVIALDRISFEIADQTFVSIVGPSGCGKSTLLNILSGVEVPTAGTAEIRNGAIKARVGYVFQAARLLPWRTVIDNMLFVQTNRTSETRERMVRYLEMVGLSDVQQAYPAQLSGGMQQRVGIARAFSIEPSALLMDEPFSHLDAINARQLRKELQSIWASTMKTVVFVTHDVAEAVELSNRVLILEKGGKLREDLVIDLPFPRDPSDPDVALLRAEVLRRFDDETSE
jgi:NitT/TauT family transport system ATP-binding protein